MNSAIGLQPKIAVIIPVYNEGEKINSAISRIKDIQDDVKIEIAVIDGSENFSTLNSINDKDVKKLHSPKGRALQMNHGAASVKGDILLFLHADTILPVQAFSEISRSLHTGKFIAGAFTLGFDSNRMSLKLIAFGAWLRYTLTKIPFGDQGIFVEKKFFHNLGGYSDIPFLEDVELMKRIKKSGKKIYISKERVTTSARRWERDGILFTTLRNWLIQILYMAGVSPKKLKVFYN